MKKNQILLIIAIIIIFISSIGGFILGTKFADKELEIKNETKDNQNNNTDNEINNDITQVQVEEVIEKELKQLLPLKSINELTNQDKLQTLLEIYAADQGYTETISKETLNTTFNNSCINRLGIEYGDIYWDHMLQDTNEKHYELKGEVYTNVIGGHGASQLNTIYKKIVDYNEQEDKVTISYKYAFYKVSFKDNTFVNVFSHNIFETKKELLDYVNNLVYGSS